MCTYQYSEQGVMSLQVMSYSDGSSEVHYFNQFLSEPQDNEAQRFSDMLNSIIY